MGWDKDKESRLQVTVMSKPDSTGGVEIYYQLKQIWMVRKMDKN